MNTVAAVVAVVSGAALIGILMKAIVIEWRLNRLRKRVSELHQTLSFGPPDQTGADLPRAEIHTWRAAHTLDHDLRGVYVARAPVIETAKLI